jgi:hypothetical protein
VNYEEVMRWLAVMRIAGNWDSYGYSRGKNMYAYKPDNAGWELIGWDIDFVLGSGSDGPETGLFGGQDPVLNNFRNHPPVLRAYWCALQEAVSGPMVATRLAQILDAKFNALSTEGAGPGSPQFIKDYVAARKTYIEGQLASVAASFQVQNNGGADFSTNRNLIVLSGTAPVCVKTIEINGILYTPTWASVTGWTVRYALSAGTNVLTIRGLDLYGNPYTNSLDTISIHYTGQDERPEDQVVINEIMYNPAASGAGFVEIHNRSVANAFDLSGWRLDGVDYDFPDGTIIEPGQFLVVVADPTSFVAAYGTAIPILGVFDGRLDNGGETLRLLKRGVPPAQDKVFDAVLYDDTPPWPVAADGGGSSLQLIDPARDNERARNWAVATVDTNQVAQQLVVITNLWRYDQVSDLSAAAWTATNYNDTAWPQGLGLLYVETAPLPAPINTPLTLGRNTYYFRTRFNFNGNPAAVALKLSTIIDDGAVYYLNGQEIFRLGMAGGAVNYATFANRTVGDAALEGPFTVPTTALRQGTNVLAVEVHQVTAGSSDIVFGCSLMSEPLGQLAPFTPGAANSTRASLPAFPRAWLNEASPAYVAGPADSFGDRDGWVEIYNSGTNDLSLDGYWLTDNYTNLTKWAFPTGISIPARGFRLVWMDGETNESSPSELHASFSLPQMTGSVALVTTYNGAPAAIDHLTYDELGPGRSYGDYPDGNASVRQSFAIVTPGATNNPVLPPVAVFINEWMPRNTSAIFDPYDGNFEDWFELFNGGTNPVDISGYYLTDDLTNRFKWQIPDGTVIPARGYLLVWADGEPGQNTATNADRHANFSLDADGEAIGLFTPGGVLVNSVIFTNAVTDVSQGRFPDGAVFIAFMTNDTPRAANVLVTENFAPVLSPVGNRTVNEGNLLSFLVNATDVNAGQTLTYSLAPGAPTNATLHPTAGLFSWIPTEQQGGSNYTIVIVVSDNGSPSLLDSEPILVTVNKVNSPPSVPSINNKTVVEGTPLSFTAVAVENDLPPQTVTWSLDPGFPPGAGIHPTTGEFTWTPTEAQGTNVYVLVLRATDDGEPPLSQFVTVIIFVAESNLPPVLTLPASITVEPGGTAQFTANATDADLPAQLLRFSLAPGAPAGATIDTNSGQFTWVVPVHQPPGTNAVTVAVTDNGPPSRIDSKTVNVVIDGVRITSVTHSSGTVTLEWNSASNRVYQVQFKNHLGEMMWQPLGTNITASAEATTASDAVGTNTHRLYRVLRLP